MTAPAPPEKRWAKPASSRSTFTKAALLALLVLVGWLLSERNARHYALVVEGTQLTVKKGILFPVGRQAYQPDDPALSQAYAPLSPPPGAKVEEERTFDDRAGLDQALFALLAAWARADIATEKPEQLERALGWLARAERLQQVSAAQRADLLSLRAESGFFEARGLVERAAEALRQARERLRLAAGSSSPHAGEAAQALRALDPLMDETYRASRQLGAAREGGPPPATPPDQQPGAEATGGAETARRTIPVGACRRRSRPPRPHPVEKAPRHSAAPPAPDPPPPAAEPVPSIPAPETTDGHQGAPEGL